MIENPTEAFKAIGDRIDALAADGSPEAVKQGQLLNQQRLMMIREMLEQSDLTPEERLEVEIKLREAHKAANGFGAPDLPE